MSTIDDLRTGLSAFHYRSPEYINKMMHDVPDAPVVDRKTFIAERVAGQTVLDIGASGVMHEIIVDTASSVYGIDRPPEPILIETDKHFGQNCRIFDCTIPPLPNGIVGIDLDDIDAKIPFYPDVSLIVCGEVLEHLANPGFFLKRLRATYQRTPVIISVPNAFSEIASRHMMNKIENVHREHFYWFSWHTLKALLERHGYAIRELYWYGGRPRFSEGLIVVTE